MTTGEVQETAAIPPPFDPELLAAMSLEEQIIALRNHTAELAGNNLPKLIVAAELAPYGDDPVWDKVASTAWRTYPRSDESVEAMLAIHRAADGANETNSRDIAWVEATEHTNSIMTFGSADYRAVESIKMLTEAADGATVGQVMYIAERIKEPAALRRTDWYFAKRLAELGLPMKTEWADRLTNEQRTEVRRLQIMRVLENETDGVERAKQSAVQLPIGERTLIYIGIAKQEGPASNAWEKIPELVERPHRIPVKHRLEIVHKLLENDRITEAEAIAHSIPFYDDVLRNPETNSENELPDYRTQAMLAIADHQARQNDLAGAHAELSIVAEDQQALLTLAVCKGDTEVQITPIVLTNTQNTITEVRFKHMALDAADNPTAAVGALQEYATHAAGLELYKKVPQDRYAAAHLLPALVRAGHIVEAAVFVNTMRVSDRVDAFAGITRTLRAVQHEQLEQHTGLNAGRVAAAAAAEAAPNNESPAE